MSNSHPQLARSSSLRCRVSRRISRHSLSQRATHPDLDLASAQDWQSAGPQLCYLGADTVQTPDPSVDTRHTRLTVMDCSDRQLRLCASTTPHLKASSTTAASSVISRGLQHEMSPPSTTSHPSPPPPPATASPASSCSGNDASYKRWRTSTHPRVQRGNRSNSWQSLIPHSCFVLLAVLSALPSGVYSGPHERRLINDLLEKYNDLERPVFNESDALTLKFGLTLQQIIDVDEKNQILTTNIWLNLEWTDVNLKWNTSEYGNVEDIRIPPHKIWKPDVLMYNSADEAFDGTYPVKVVVRNTGALTYIPPGIFKSTCKRHYLVSI